MIKLLSGNEALALGAYHSGVRVAAAYPGTPSTEILEALAQNKDVYAEWSTNEKVAMEVGMGAALAGARSLVTMKQVGFNVATDPFMAVALTGVNGGMVVINADDPGIHSSQGEQDNRHYAKLAKVPMLEPSDSQEAYDLMIAAYDLSEKFDTPVLLRSTTRISHSKSRVEVRGSRPGLNRPAAFRHDVAKYVMLPNYARIRHVTIEDRLIKLSEFAESFPFNKIIWGNGSLGVIASGIAFQYARESFPDASFLKLTMTYPIPVNLIQNFSRQVDKLIVIEELDPFLQESILALGIKVYGKEFIPRCGELNSDIVATASARAGYAVNAIPKPSSQSSASLPKRPPLLCPGCPHTGIYFTLSNIGQRKQLDDKNKSDKELNLIITGDIGCYTLGAYPPHRALDTTACMGAGIGQALGMAKAGVKHRVVAVIGDSTFLHSGITPLVNAVYDQGPITVVILDNNTTAMTGHQEHPGTGITLQRKETQPVKLDELVRGIGVKDIKIVDSFDLKALRTAVRNSIESPELSVIIVRGTCAVRLPSRAEPRVISTEKCNRCNTCLLLGCPAIQSKDGQILIDITMCAGKNCTLCEQVCPHKAISPQSEIKGAM